MRVSWPQTCCVPGTVSLGQDTIPSWMTVVVIVIVEVLKSSLFQSSVGPDALGVSGVNQGCFHSAPNTEADTLT